jgi:hypothetical protein
MMGRKERRFAPLTHISLEELVPQNHFYRSLERKLDLSFVRKFVQETYAGLGRPSIGLCCKNSQGNTMGVILSSCSA